MRQFSVFLFGALLAAGAIGQSARAADYSAPKKTVETFSKAIAAEDADALKNCFTATADTQPMVDGMSKIIVAGAHLQRVAIDKFGENGKTVMGGMGRQRNISDDIDRLKDATEKIDGETATLTPKSDANTDPDGPQIMYFKKIAGDWKVDADKMFPPNPSGNGPESGPSMQTIGPILAKAMSDTADEIKAGKYKTVEECQQSVQDKMRTAMMALLQKQTGGGPPAPNQ